MLDPRRLANNLQGADTVFDAFSHLFFAAAEALTSQQVATLEAQLLTRSPPATGWVSTAWWGPLLDHCSTLAKRSFNKRYQLREPERAELMRLAGAGALADPTKVLFLALAIDGGFSAFAADYVRLTPQPTKVVPIPPAWFRDTTTTPPPLGQMTPVAVCRRWLVNFWFVGRLDGLKAFGELPRVFGLGLPERTVNALGAADDAGRLRVGFLQWPSFGPADLQVQTSAGSFAVTGYGPAAKISDLLAAVDRARDEMVDVLVGPELALSPNDLGALQSHLKSSAARYPIVSAWGCTHRARAAGGHANEAVLLDSLGRLLMRHEKLEAFTHPQLGVEDIVPRESRLYHFADSPIGRIVLNVCRDVRSDVPMLLNRTLGVSFVVVPAYSTSLSFALEEARILGARQLAVTAAANAGSNQLEDRAFLCAPIKGMRKCSVLWTTRGTPAVSLMVADLSRKSGVGSVTATPTAA